MDEEELTTTPEVLILPLRLQAVANLAGSGDAPDEETESERREYRVTFITAGYVKKRSGGNAPWRIPAETLQAAVGLLNGVAVFVDHPGYDDVSHSVRDLAGVTFEPVWNAENQSIDGGIRLYDREDLDWLPDLLDQILDDQEAGLEVPDLGLSLILYGYSERQEIGPYEEEYVTLEIGKVESADIVFSPGAEGRLRGQLTMSNEQLTNERSPGKARTGADDRERSLNGVNQRGRSLERPREILSSNFSGGKKEMNLEDEVVSEEVVEGQAVALAAVPAPAAAPVQQHDIAQIATVLQGLVDRVEQLQAAVAGQDEAQLVSGMGQAPRGNGLRVRGMQTGLDRFGPNVEWLFGVQGAPLPDPEFRRADAIYRALTGDFEFRGVFDPERVMLASATTGTLASLAVNAMNKVIINQFANLGFWRWYERIVWVAPNDGSLHDMQWITFGGIGNLPTVNEGGTYTELTVDDVKEADAWVTKGGYVGITRKMILNSDIQRIQAVPVALAIACVRTRSAAVSDIFTSNSGVGPTLDQDSTALFHANHSNVGSTAFAQAEWRVVRNAIFKHTDVNSAKRLGIFPKYGLFPPDLYDSALSVFGYGDGYPTSYTPETQDRGYGDPRPVPLVVPDWTDTNNWAAIVDPMIFPVIQMSYHQAPGGGQHPPCEVFVAMDERAGLMFSNDTLPIKVRDEFVVGVNGPRGVYKENVA